MENRKNLCNFFIPKLLTFGYPCGIIIIVNEREVITMADKILDKVIRKYGFEHPITIWVAKIIEKIF
jgi:hypothetical protein